MSPHGSAPAANSAAPLANEETAARAELARALSALYARVPLGMRLGLEPMRAACARAGHPERAFDAVHVAGTNGKGSTCAMIEAAARAAGTRTGLYTSPHLCRFAERIRIDGAPIDDATLARVLGRALEVGHDLSFFETATLAAFLAFREAGVELAVVEVGIGGRLDATNVLPPPRCAALTRVALDHTDRLGDTLEAIAREKAAIAKPGAPIVLGPLPASVLAAARDVATAAGARVITLTGASRRERASDDDLRADVAVSLAGAHQRDNARVAWRVCAELGVDERARREGFASARWPGRLEHVRVASGPLAGAWILDGAHNVDGAEALVRALASSLPPPGALASSPALPGALAPSPAPPGALVFGALADKAYADMLRVVAELPCPRVYVAPRGRAAADPASLAALHAGTPAPSLPDALATARRLSPPDRPVVVCGSIYLVGEARARLLDLPEDPPVAL